MRQVLTFILCMLCLFVVAAPPHTALAVDAASDPSGYLEALGYTIVSMGDGVNQQEVPYAIVTMEWESKDIWSEETTTQVVSAFYALRNGFPAATALFAYLKYTDQYEVGWRVDAVDWDKYTKDKDWEALKQSESWWVGVWDNDESGFLTGSGLQKFVNKNFGAGTFTEPKYPGPITGGAYGAVALNPTEGQIKLKGQLSLTVTVLDKQKQPVSDTDVEMMVMGTATGSRVLPKASSTNEKGNAQITFSAGNTDGVAIVVAKSRGTFGVATIMVGKGDKDPAVSIVVAELAGKGYKVYGAGIDADSPDTAYADMDLLGYLADQDGNYDPVSLAQIIDGWSAVSGGYPKADSLNVITRYAGKYAIHWLAASADFADYVEEKMNADDFWSAVFDSIKVIDLKTGKEISPKDFMNKNFGSE